MPDSNLRVAVDYDDAADAELPYEAAREEGLQASEPEVRGIEPITTIILIGGGSLIVGAIGRWPSRRRRKGEQSWGQVIDLRPDATDLVYRDKDLEFGLIVVITPTVDGKTVEVKIETYDPDNDFTEVAKLVFGKLADGVAKPLDTIAKTATEAVGDKGKVSVEEAA